MLNLPSKSPASRMDDAWAIPVDPSDTVSDATISVVAGTVAIDGQSLDTANGRLVFTLSGGVAGTTTRFYVRAETAGGDIWDDTIDIYVSDTAATIGVGYVDPTPADVKADFPAFASVDDAVVARRILRTASWVDASWLETDYNYAKSLLTAHYLETDGLSSSGDAEIAAYRASGVSRLKSGTLDVTFTTSDAAAGGSEFDATAYGQRFYSLLVKNKSGVLTTGGGDRCHSPAATDYPFAYAYGGFAL